ncbi:hypothetical protein [Ferrovibrio sp.]|uniref:hypothetical protein n=1 Tax=Ferrovibrio sp. TaxID=1917215 RepID=UPI003D2D49B9
MFAAAADFHHLSSRPANRRWVMLALILSLLLHLGLAWLLYLQPWSQGLKIADAPLEVEVVIPPPAPPPPPPPQPQRVAEPPPPTAPLPPPEVPQLQRAPQAEKSTAPPPKAQAEAPKPPTPPPAPPTQPAPRTTEAAPPPPRPVQRRTEASSVPLPKTAAETMQALKVAPEMKQSEQDFFLSQIVDHWLLKREAPQFEEVQIGGAYLVLPNGMLGPPFNANDPEDFRLMIKDWDVISRRPDLESFATAIRTFVIAMRRAQPFDLPPDFGDKPKRMTLNFRVRDIP